jgi:hypothetical protein
LVATERWLAWPFAHHQGRAPPGSSQAAPSRLPDASAREAGEGPDVIHSASLHEAPGHLEAPDLIEPVVAFRRWRTFGGQLRSPYVPVFWDEPVLHAECQASRYHPAQKNAAHEPHSAPHPDCSCGIYAYLEPDREFPMIDYRGVTGIVTLWGNVEVHTDGMRAEHARVEALALYQCWSNHQKNAVWRIADDLGVDVIDLDEIEHFAERYGGRLPAALLP